MSLFKLISYSEYFKYYISLFLIFFFMSNLIVAKADENKYLIKNQQEENKLNEFLDIDGIGEIQVSSIKSFLQMK